jgi:hypothetical protein
MITLGHGQISMLYKRVGPLDLRLADEMSFKTHL